LSFVFSTQCLANPFPKGWRVLPKIDRDIKDSPMHHANQLSLRPWGDLVVQSTQDVLRRSGVIILNELDVKTRCLLECILIEALEKKSSIIPEYFGFQNKDTG